MAIVVTFDGTRLDDASDQALWTDWGATATDEPDFFYNGGQCISCLVKTAEVGQAYEHGSTTDFETTPKAWLAKIIQNNYGSIDDAQNGLQLYMGESTTVHYRYEIFKSTTYPSLGGWQIVPIDPNVAGYITENVGSMADATAIDFFGMKSECSATAKAPNLGSAAIDYIDSGTGLTLVGTDTTPGAFQDFVDFDVGTGSNRYGIVSTKSGVIYVVGVLTIGSSSETDFDDANQEIVYPDGRFNTGFCGLDIVLGNASSVIVIASCVFRGRGEYGHDGGTADTRPDFEVSGTNGSATLDGCSFLNHRNVTFTSASSMNGGRIECRLLTQNSANISNVTIVTDSLTSVACLQDPVFGTTTDLHDADFIQGGAGHAIELTTVGGTYNMLNISFTGYGADTTDSAALDVTAASGTTTINITGAAAPTYKTAGATVVINVNPVTVSVTVEDEAQVAIQNAHVYINKEGQEQAYTADTGNTAGNGALIVNETVDTGIPQSGWCFVWVKSLNKIQPYRFSSWAVKTFTFPTTVSYDCTGGGTATLLQDSVNDFIALDIQVGDTVRNIDDGSWAVVDEITDADNIVTSPLSGGTLNIWTSGDTYSFHDLATTLTDNDDLVDIPYSQQKTDSNGEITQSLTAYGFNLLIRVRYTEGATKYDFAETIQPLGSNGLTTTIALKEQPGIT